MANLSTTVTNVSCTDQIIIQFVMAFMALEPMLFLVSVGLFGMTTLWTLLAGVLWRHRQYKNPFYYGFIPNDGFQLSKCP